MDKILANEEIRSLSAMGTGFGAEFDVSKARYQKLVLMTDADVDGAHIVLSLTLIYRYMKPILEAGYKLILPNLQFMGLRLELRLKNISSLEQIEEIKLQEALARHSEGRAKPTIQRYKGLG